jgi:dTDP-glucose 4,6-dehydratase
MKSILIIGGSGYVGKSILDAFSRNLLNGINKIYVLSRNASKLAITNPELININIFLIDDDIRTCKELPHTDFIIHAAATTDSNKYINNPSTEKINIISAVENFAYLLQKNNRKSKILYISSGAVYGNQPINNTEIDELCSTTGDISNMPLNKIPYTYAKRICENKFKDLSSVGYKICIVRGFSFVGKYLPLNGHFAIGNFIRDGILKRTIKVHAYNYVYRSYMYSDDMVAWLVFLLERASCECPIFNLGSNEAISIDNLAYKIASIFNVEVEIENDTRVSIDRYIPNINKAINSGLILNYNLDRAIDETIKRLFIQK